MKKIVLALSVIASAFLLASCANKGTDQADQTAVSNNTTAKMAAPAKKQRHHHDYKAESVSK